MHKKIGVLLIAIGAVLILSALLLLGYNRLESDRAAQNAEKLLHEVHEKIPKEPQPALQPEEPQASVIEVEGYPCIGTLAIPDLELELPVLDDWSYKRLKVAPCRQFGSAQTDDLVIAAHNYKRHFGLLKTLPQGTPVTFTDVNGTVYNYQIDRVQTLQPTDVELVENSEAELVLYTCTYGGKTRVTVFCYRVDAEGDPIYEHERPLVPTPTPAQPAEPAEAPLADADGWQ